MSQTEGGLLYGYIERSLPFTSQMIVKIHKLISIINRMPNEMTLTCIDSFDRPFEFLDYDDWVTSLLSNLFVIRTVLSSSDGVAV